MGAHEREQSSDTLPALLRRANDDLKQLRKAPRIQERARQLLPCELAVARNERERLVQVVRNAGGHLAKRSKLIGPRHRLTACIGFPTPRRHPGYPNYADRPPPCIAENQTARPEP